jgi:hypothetical protein
MRGRLSGLRMVVSRPACDGVSTRLAVDSKPVSVHASDICIVNSCNF